MVVASLQMVVILGVGIALLWVSDLLFKHARYSERADRTLSPRVGKADTAIPESSVVEQPRAHCFGHTPVYSAGVGYRHRLAHDLALGGWSAVTSHHAPGDGGYRDVRHRSEHVHQSEACRAHGREASSSAKNAKRWCPSRLL